LQDGVIDRVGSTESRQVDVRVIAATHRDLKAEVAAGRFREDLLYRLNVIELVVPPLRERREDVPPLLDCLLDRHAKRLNRPRPTVPAETVAALCGMAWPGNVRELENAVERAILLAESDSLGASDFGQPAESVPAAAAGAVEGSSLKDAARAAAAETERRMIVEALEATGGNVTQATERLGLSRRGLQIKMKELGLR
jgi:DNA-binding NtrC family response regulator